MFNIAVKDQDTYNANVYFFLHDRNIYNSVKLILLRFYGRYSNTNDYKNSLSSRYIIDSYLKQYIFINRPGYYSNFRQTLFM